MVLAYRFYYLCQGVIGNSLIISYEITQYYCKLELQLHDLKVVDYL